MFRVVSSVYVDSQIFTISRRDVFKLFLAGMSTQSSSTPAAHQTVLMETSAWTPSPVTEHHPPPPPPPPPPPSPPPRRAWLAAAAAALTASFGGVYLYRKLNVEPQEQLQQTEHGEVASAEAGAEPARADGLPRHAHYLLVGGGTASFAAMRALRAARPDSLVLLVSEERALPYMRPPLSKELWREPELARKAADPDTLTFQQWNGKRRSVVYEPSAFYLPPERLREGDAGAGVALGWRVTRVEPTRHEAELRAPSGETHVITYDKCLIATGVRARRAAALAGAAAAGRAVAVRGVRDVARLAALLDDERTRRVTVLGGGLLATELSAALALRLRGSGKAVQQVYREAAPLAALLPPYLGAETARRLDALGVHTVPDTEVTASEACDEGGGAVRLRLAGGGALHTDLVVECVGSEPNDELARRSGLELHPELGGIVVNAEMQARTDVYAAGDVSCFYDPALGRRRVEHHDHAVVSGRLAGDNMAATTTPRPYTHQSMFWSDVGPDLGYEAVGIIDSQLPTVGVFSEDAVSDAVSHAATQTGGEAQAETTAAAATGTSDGSAAPPPRRYERGVVFYLRESRVVGVLLWNMFNRMQVARQVLSQGQFDDMFEVAKLFAPQDEE